jgi:hypothetical protein
LSEAVYSTRFKANIGVGMIATPLAKGPQALRAVINGDTRSLEIRPLPFA